MGEMKSAVISMMLFVGLVIPILLGIAIGSLQQQAFIKFTSEMTNLVKEEGGVTSKVIEAKEAMEERGYTISFTDENGSAVTGRGNYGEQINAKFSYEYQSVTGVETLNTDNNIIVNRR